MNIRKISIVALVVPLICATIVSSAHPFLPSYASLTTKEERELGDKLMLYVKRHYELISDPIIVDYVNVVGQRIVSNFPGLPFTYRFYILKEDV